MYFTTDNIILIFKKSFFHTVFECITGNFQIVSLMCMFCLHIHVMLMLQWNDTRSSEFRTWVYLTFVDVKHRTTCLLKFSNLRKIQHLCILRVPTLFLSLVAKWWKCLIRNFWLKMAIRGQHLIKSKKSWKMIPWDHFSKEKIFWFVSRKI